MRSKLAPILLLFVGLSVCAHAQLWSGIISPNRAVDWSKAGVTGGIPNRTTTCAILSPGATASQINSAIANCPGDQVVQLNAGTYNLSTGLTFAGKNNVTLRGAGADKTILVFSGSNSCLGKDAHICFPGNDLGYYGPGPARNSASWTGGYTKGTTTITLSSTTGLSVGMYIALDQLDNSTSQASNNSVFNCAAGTCTVEGGTEYGRPGRNERDFVQVTAINGNNVTISPGVRLPDVSSGRSPGAWWGSSSSFTYGNGVEDLSIMGANSSLSDGANVTFIFTRDSWMKGVRSVEAPSPQTHVFIFQAAHITVQDSYLYGSKNDASASQNYGISEISGADNLIVNNIVQRRTSPFVANGAVGSVYAYNFTIFDHYENPTQWMQASNYSHEAGNMYILHEGNISIGAKGDIIHGTSNLFSFFRNYLKGWESGKTAETNPVKLYSYNRYWHFIGNVLGTSSYHSTYSANGDSDKAIFSLGVGSGSIPADAFTSTSLMRWGNYDTVNNAVRWQASEVPSSIANFPNAVPANQDLPASFFLSYKPSWFGNVPWPAIGPDVAAGNIAGLGGHANKIPAQLCYESSGGTADGLGSVLSFNSARCYGSASAAPAPPTGLSAVAK